MIDEQICIIVASKDPYITEAIHNMYNWDSNNCYIASEAETYEDALKTIKMFHPNLVIVDSDLDSPESGFNLMRTVLSDSKTYNSLPVFLAISHEKSYETASKAINSGARGIICLPEDDHNPETTLQIKTTINLAKQFASGRRFYIKYIEQNKLETIRQLFINNKLMDDTYKTTLDINDYQIAILSPKHCGYDNNPFELDNLISQSFLPIHHHELTLEPIKVIIFVNEDEDIIYTYMNRFCAKVNPGRNNCIATLGKKAHGLAGALESFNEAKDLLGHLIYFSSKPYIQANDVNNLKGDLSDVNNEIPQKILLEFLAQVNSLVQYIEIYDLNRIVSIIDEKREQLRTQNLSIHALQMIGMAFVVQVQDSIHKKHPEKEFKPLDTLDFVNKVYSQIYFDGILDTIIEFTSKLATSFVDVASDSKILKVIQYIRENYDQELKLEAIASLFECNSAYLGKKFHEFTGTSFNSYLDDLRITKAKELLRDNNYKIYEISTMLGYSNTDYFYLKFKKNTGLTPKEFQKQHRK